MTALKIKICGITDPEILHVAVEEGVAFAGLVFYPPSPRYLTPDQASAIVQQKSASIKITGLFVNPSDHDLLPLIPLLDMIQLHGDETPQRTGEIAALANLPVIKAIRIYGPEDLDPVPAYEEVVDWLLFDSKASPRRRGSQDAEEKDPLLRGDAKIRLPGGTGERFNWALLKNRKFKKPWMLAGGLTPENIGEALHILAPDAVDVSSGVESAPGTKDPAKIKAFIAAANRAI